jgi:alginate production protein
MSRRDAAITAGVWMCVFLMALFHAADQAHAGDAELSSPPPSDSGEPEEDEEDQLRQRLTEREDKRRPAKPWSTERPGHVVHREREDESDARLGWLGARLMGVWDLRTRGILGYWLDTALVRGEERLVEFDELSGSRSLAEELTRRDVRGWALDAGLNWILPVALEPRLFTGYAFGSGDREPEQGADRSFRQTALHANEAGFGGVERFAHYGVLLDPELSNLHVFTIGAGLSLLRSSSLDLIYHHYRLAEPASFLREAGVEATLTGEHRDLGHELDLVLALEEWERLELEVIGSVLLPGRAFGSDRGEWSYGGLVAIRFAF